MVSGKIDPSLSQAAHILCTFHAAESSPRKEKRLKPVVTFTSCARNSRSRRICGAISIGSLRRRISSRRVRTGGMRNRNTVKACRQMGLLFYPLISFLLFTAKNKREQDTNNLDKSEEGNNDANGTDSTQDSWWQTKKRNWERY